MIEFTQKGDFNNLEKLLNKILGKKYLNILAKYGQMGVAVLSAATPVDSGQTATSWNYEIIQNGGETKLVFTNSNINKGVNIAVILQYGHGTGTGGYVQGRDYINPAVQPVFDKLAEELWREVAKA